MSNMNDNGIIDLHINKDKYERTAIAKKDLKNARRVTIVAAHAATNQIKPNPAILQQGKDMGCALATTVRRLVRKFTRDNQKVRFAHKPNVARFHNKEEPIMITYYSVAVNHYMSEDDRIGLGLPILRPSQKRVAVANGGTSSGNYVTHLPFPQLSSAAAEADTFEEFPSSLLSVGKTSDDGNVAVFTDKKSSGVQRGRCSDHVQMQAHSHRLT